MKNAATTRATPAATPVHAIRTIADTRGRSSSDLGLTSRSVSQHFSGPSALSPRGERRFDTIRLLTVRRRTIPASNPFKGTVTRELIHAAKCLRAYFEQTLAEDGESLSTFLVLDVVDKAGGSTQRELAEGVRIEGATMTRHLDRLEEAGLITRRRDPNDRRAILIDLTPEGKKTHSRLRARMTAAHDAAWTGINKSEREIVRSVAMKLSENVEGLSAERSEVAHA
ncbi:MAG TPA: MarR family transcriptional regulator [Actinomycetota bacterium]